MLVRPWALPSLPHSWFVSPQFPSLFFFSPLGVSCPFLGVIHVVFRSISSLGENLFLSSLPVVHALTGSSSTSMLLSFRVHSFSVLWVLFQWCSFVPCSCASCILLVSFWLFLHALALSFSRLILFPVLFLRTLWVSSFHFIILRLLPMPPLCLFLFPLPLPLWGPSVIPLILWRTVFALLHLLWLFPEMLLFLPFWSQPFHVPLPCSRPFVFFSFPLARASLSVLFWLRVLWLSSHNLVLLYFYNGCF